MTCFERTLPVHRGKYTTGLPWEDDMPVRVKQPRLVWRMLTGARVQRIESLTVHLIAVAALWHCWQVDNTIVPLPRDAIRAFSLQQVSPIYDL